MGKKNKINNTCLLFLYREDYRAMRHTVIDMILATEMTKHFEHLSKFVNFTSKPVVRDSEDTLSMVSNDYLHVHV